MLTNHIEEVKPYYETVFLYGSNYGFDIDDVGFNFFNEARYLVTMEVLECLGTAPVRGPYFIPYYKVCLRNEEREVICPVKFFWNSNIEIGDKITIAIQSYDSSYGDHGGYDIKVLSWISSERCEEKVNHIPLLAYNDSYLFDLRGVTSVAFDRNSSPIISLLIFESAGIISLPGKPPDLPVHAVGVTVKDETGTSRTYHGGFVLHTSNHPRTIQKGDKIDLAILKADKGFKCKVISWRSK